MKVQFKDGVKRFDFQEGDYVTLVVSYLSAAESEDELYYHGKITQIEEDNSGFWCVLDNDKTKEEFFSFLDLEDVIAGDRIPFLSGTTKRSDFK